MSIRDALEQALDTESAPAAEETVATEITSPETPTSESVQPETSAAGEQTDKLRDSLGRFVPKTPEVKAEGQAPAAPVVPGEQPPAAPVTTPAPVTSPDLKAPQSWSPAAREHWNAVPPQVREQVLQREQQVQVALQQSADARRFAGEFNQMMQPYLPFMRAEGAAPMQAVQNLMDIAVTLRTGTAAEKARTIAQIVGAYGVDIAALDGALAGAIPDEPQGFDPSLVQREVQRALSPILQQVQTKRMEQAQQTAQQVQTELDAFASDPKHEFFNDVRGLMADLIDMNNARGVPFSLEQAYNVAVRVHPEISKVLDARALSTQATAMSNTAQRAKAAAVQVKGEGAQVGPATGNEPSSIRGAIEAAIETASRV